MSRKTDSSTNVVPEQIEHLPVADRDFQRLAFIAPTVQRERGEFRFISGGPVVGASGNASQATILVDGVDLTDPGARTGHDAIQPGRDSRVPSHQQSFRCRGRRVRRRRARRSSRARARTSGQGGRSGSFRTTRSARAARSNKTRWPIRVSISAGRLAALSASTRRTCFSRSSSQRAQHLALQARGRVPAAGRGHRRADCSDAAVRRGSITS